MNPHKKHTKTDRGKTSIEQTMILNRQFNIYRYVPMNAAFFIEIISHSFPPKNPPITQPKPKKNKMIPALI